MRMESYSTRSSNRGWLILAGVIVIAGLVYALFLRGGRNQADPEATPAAQAQQNAPKPQQASSGQNDPQNSAGQDAPQDNDPPAEPDYAFNRIDGMTPELAAGIGPSPITVTPISDADAQQAFRQGVEAYQQDKLLDARTLLNRAYTYGKLPPAQAQRARELLTDLANRTILRADPYVNPKDPYLESYTFEMGDRLGSIRRDGKIVRLGIVAKLDLNTPYDIIVMANGLQKDTQFKAGRAYKMIRGPFHLVVDLSEFAADLYVQDLFLRRMPVCIGALETPTPTGYFRIPMGGKTPMSAYNAPVESGLPNVSILPGEPDYPLGPRGLNIKLEGIRQLGTGITVNQSYAIHGTNEPASIGTAASRGCVRMRAEDIHLVYVTLMDYADPTNPQVNWNRYSTVRIKK